MARKAKKDGARYALRIIWEARAAGIPVSLGFAIVEQESEFQNVFGHDPTIFVGAGTVTKAKYKAYKSRRGSRGQGGMQGVGPCQLTYYSFQDEADRLGGCWNPKYNIRAAFRDLAHLIRVKGLRDGIKAYNGTGPQAVQYASSVLKRQRRWHDVLS